MKIQDKNLKRHVSILFLIAVISILLVNITVIFFAKQTEKKSNEALAVLLGNVKLQYPDIAEEEWIAMLNHAEGYAEGRALLERYGIFEEDSALVAVRGIRVKLLICLNGIFLAMCIGAIFVFARYFARRRARLEELKRYVCEVEQGRYVLDIAESEEDELSMGGINYPEDVAVLIVEAEEIIGIIQSKSFPFHKTMLVSPAVPYLNHFERQSFVFGMKIPKPGRAVYHGSICNVIHCYLRKIFLLHQSDQCIRHTFF